MLSRYSTEEMAGVWSEEAKFRNWAKVEIATLKAKHELGYIPWGPAENLLKQIKIDVDEINRIEKNDTRGSFAAFYFR